MCSLTPLHSVETSGDKEIFTRKEEQGKRIKRGGEGKGGDSESTSQGVCTPGGMFNENLKGSRCS